jgi:hypothetical protein
MLAKAGAPTLQMASQKFFLPIKNEGAKKPF